MRGWSLRSPGAREAVHITLLSLLAAAITLALCAVFGVVGVVGLCVDARSGGCGRGGAAGERTPLKT